ncbi:MAG: pre-peptidase C-terminal domain-containing protein [Gemmataceae bacterium]|nr:pre-peptidase C-terminal domain-containing protein [Gemmataceae bacterium]
MISFSCPSCQATFKLQDELAGKTARCSKCNQRFTVPGGKPKAPAAVAAPAPPKKPVLKPAPEVMEAEVVDEPMPPRRPGARPRVDEVDVVDQGVDEVQVVDEAAIQEPRRGRRPMAVDDEEDDDRRRPSRRDRGRDAGDDDDDLDRPRRRRRGRSGGSKMGIIIASVGGGVVVLVLVIIAIVVNRPAVVNNPPMNFNPPPNPGPDVGGAQPIQLVNGSFQTIDRIALTDPMDPRRANWHAKRYSVQLEAGKSYAIEMDAVGAGAVVFDPYLRVENPAANFHREDDDSGVGELDSRIVFLAPQAGTYIITATTFAPRMQGNYRLTVRTPP